MKLRRGDVVLVDFPFSDGSGSKPRPALVLQNDRDNARLRSVILAMLTTRTDRAGAEATQFLVDLGTPEGRQTGLMMNSVVNCCNLLTVDQRLLIRVLGRFSPMFQAKVDACLKAALALS